ncbi:MAG: hypothetical protein LLG24_05490 [Actinomycetia bacterium]|nr:hypothetical protein [Actinomycetes bacterium]
MPVLAYAVDDSLRAYAARTAVEGVVQVGGSFTPDPSADELIKSNPNAFLIGVLFTQGISAERAWSGPYELSQRLGGFDLERMAVDEDAVARAFREPPALHRFVKTVPRWVSSAARRIVETYAGDASHIWPEGAHVIDVTSRLLSFEGIGPKKAAMAAELLIRALGVPLSGIQSGTVAYDVHVRRVFLRSGLVDRDTPDAVRRAAARICPAEPGSLDLATWRIGREYCRPQGPRCDECPLGTGCPRMMERSVEGVGVRR